MISGFRFPGRLLHLDHQTLHPSRAEERLGRFGAGVGGERRPSQGGQAGDLVLLVLGLVNPASPLRTKGVVYRLDACVIPSEGLYWVELRYNGSVLDREALLVEELP